MALSQVDIVNKALTLVGASPIVSLTEDTNNARITNRVYEAALRSILTECKWNFATKRADLSVSGDDLDWFDIGETNLYIRPADTIKIFGVSDPAASWREEGDYIISDSSGLGVRYVFYNIDPATYSADFITAFIDRLASDIAYAIVNSASLGEKYKNLYESVSLPKALSSNSQGGVQQNIQDDAWELAKYHDGQKDA